MCEAAKRLTIYSLVMFFQHHLPKNWFFILQPTITPLSLPSSHRGLSLFAGSLILFNHWSIVYWSVPQPWSLSWFVMEKIPSTCSISSCVSCHFRNSLSDATIYLIGVQMGIFSDRSLLSLTVSLEPCWGHLFKYTVATQPPDMG